MGSLPLQARRMTRLARACRLLWRDYKPSHWYWEIVDTMRKLSLTCFILFIDTNQGSSRLMRLVIGGLVSTLYLTFLTIAQPYKRKADLYLASLCSSSLCFCFSLAFLVKLCEEGAWIVTCHDYFGLSHPQDASVTVVAIGMLIVVVVLIVVVAQSKVLLSSTPTIRLVSTGSEPPLELCAGCSFHGFISHSWKTGPFQCYAWWV